MRIACVGQPDSFQGWEWGGWGVEEDGREGEGSRVTRSDAELAQNVVCASRHPQVNAGLVFWWL